jgi:hypothetical protein
MESGELGRWASLRGAALDLVTDVATAPRRVALMRAAPAGPGRRVLAISVARPVRAGSAAAAAYELERSHLHTVDVRLAAPRPGADKWENLNALLEHNPAAGYDWLLVFDDDVILPRRFLDTFLLLSERFDLTLAQPSHKHWSHAAAPVMRRRAGTLVRKVPPTQIGPVLAIHAGAFAAVLPLSEERLEAVAEHGIVDATPIRHTRPISPAPARPADGSQRAAEPAARG